ncbi:hypothetical protein [Lysinibacillus sp. CTST325]
MNNWIIEKLNNASYEIKEFNPSLIHWIHLGLLAFSIVMLTLAGERAVLKGMEGDILVSYFIPFLKYSIMVIFVIALTIVCYRYEKEI